MHVESRGLTAGAGSRILGWYVSMGKVLPTLVLAALAGCGTSPRADTGADGSVDAVSTTDVDEVSIAMDTPDVPNAPLQLRYESAPYDLAVGQEVPSVCESWTLNNRETLFVNAVTFTNAGGLHHSNWVHVPQTYFVGPDGRWPCA